MRALYVVIAETLSSSISVAIENIIACAMKYEQYVETWWKWHREPCLSTSSPCVNIISVIMRSLAMREEARALLMPKRIRPTSRNMILYYMKEWWEYENCLLARACEMTQSRMATRPLWGLRDELSSHSLTITCSVPDRLLALRDYERMRRLKLALRGNL